MLEPYSVPFIDTYGKVRRIQALSLRDRAWFSQLQAAAKELVQDHDFRILYDSNSSHFRALVDECLLMHRISPAWVDAYQATRLLFGMGDEAAILITLNYPVETGDEDAKPIPEGLDPDAYQIAALWGATDSLEQALRISSTEPWSEVQAVLRCRSRQVQELDKDGKRGEQEEQRLKHSQEVMDRLAKSGRLQEFMDAGRKERDGEATGIEWLPDDYL